MPTNNASGTFSGTGFTIPVTVCNLDSDITITDFLPFISGTPVSTALFTKTSPTVLTYIGTSLSVPTAIIIQRRTPNTTRTGLVTFASRFSSDAWNKEVDRTVRHSEEYALNGIGPGSVVIAPVPQMLHERMQGIVDRRARFVSTLVAVRSASDPEPLVATGRWAGEVLDSPLGSGGFGYDPLLFIAALGKTVAELDATTKNAHSHRAVAAAEMLALMRAHWQLG